jgi:hypothetical protein
MKAISQSSHNGWRTAVGSLVATVHHPCAPHSAHTERGDGDAAGRVLAGLSGATWPRQGDFATPDTGREATWAGQPRIVATAPLLCGRRQNGYFEEWRLFYARTLNVSTSGGMVSSGHVAGSGVVVWSGAARCFFPAPCRSTGPLSGSFGSEHACAAAATGTPP